MKLKVAAWNMDHWKHRNVTAQAWDYLDKEIDPHIALVQEAVPPIERQNEFCLWREIGQKRRWGSGVLTKTLPLKEIGINNQSYLGAVTVSQITLPKDASLKIPLIAISMYGLWDKYRYTIPVLHTMLSDLTHLLDGKLHGDRKPAVILGGDLNASPQWDKKYHTKTHGNFFERLKALGLVDCSGEFDDNRPATHRHNKSKYPWVFDYIFASNSLAKSIKSHQVIDNPKVHAFSDHNPVVVTFDL